MKIAGMITKDRKDNMWLAKLPLLDLIVQAESKEEIPEMVKDSIELLVDDNKFAVNVDLVGNAVLVTPSDTKKLIALLLKRQRQRRSLTLKDVAASLKSKSINDYAQYEQGKHLPSIDTLESLLEAIDPQMLPYLACGSLAKF